VPCPPAPGFASAEQAGEIVELYWQALLRDVPFTEYGSNPLAAKAAAELSANAAFPGPRRGRVTPDTLFRGSMEGDLAGPYISQFLWKPIPFLPIKIEQKIRTAVPAVDYRTDFEGWLVIQNGALSGVNHFDDSRFIRNGRDLGSTCTGTSPTSPSCAGAVSRRRCCRRRIPKALPRTRPTRRGMPRSPAPARRC
jgi:hypothetical protein